MGKSRRSRPRKTWNSEEEAILKERRSNWKSAEEMTEDRKKWKKFVKGNGNG